jgi:signal transduction histidine kinase
MPNRFELTTQPVRAGRLLLLALATTFLAEFFIMNILSYLLPADCSDTSKALADSILLTLIVAPFLWIIAVVPIQRLAQSRTHFLRRALTSQEDERRRITRDIHDGIGQSLTSLMLGLRTMEETVADATIRRHTASLRKLGAEIHDDLRRIVRGLRPMILDQLGLVAAIERLLEELRNSGTSVIVLDASEMCGVRLNAELESTAFRILQEAISNSLRHASASQIRVVLAIKNDNLKLSVSDNGIGFETSAVFRHQGGGHGLLSIRERAMICGGQAEILTSLGCGTTISAELPLIMRSEQND